MTSTPILRGSVLSYGTFILSKLLLYGATLVLARVLVPRDFGLVGLALLIISFLDVVSDLGIPAALIYRQDATATDNDEVFTLSIVAGAAFFVLTWVLAPLGAGFFHDARLELITRVLGFTFVLAAMGDVHGTLLQKEMRFGRRYLPDLVMAGTKGIVSVVLALHGLGYWSLIWGQLAGQGADTLVKWAMKPWLPRPHLHWSTAKRFLAYGMHVSAVNILGVFLYNGDYAIVGRVLGAGALGLYTLAYTLPQMVSINLVVSLSQVVFPAYARVQSDSEALRRGYLSVLRYSGWVLIPVSLGMFITAPALIHVLYRPVWWGAVPVMQALSLYGLLYALGWNAGDAFKAIGRPDLLWKIALGHIFVLLPCLVLGALTRGIVGVAVAHLCIAVPYSAVRFWVTRRVLHASWTSMSEVMWRPFTAGVVLLAASYPLSRLEAPPLAILVLQTIAGSVTYIAVLLLLERDARSLVQRIVGNLRVRPATPGQVL